MVGGQAAADDLGGLAQGGGTHDARDTTPGEQGHRRQRSGGVEDQDSTRPAVLDGRAGFANERFLRQRQRPQTVDAPTGQAAPGQRRTEGDRADGRELVANGRAQEHGLSG